MATPGGKIRLLRPVAFADQIVSIGSLGTFTDVARSIVLGAEALVLQPGGSSAVASVVIGASASSINSDSVVVVGHDARVNSGAMFGSSFAQGCIVVGAYADLNTGPYDNHGFIALGPNTTGLNFSYRTSVVGSGAGATNAYQSVVIGAGASCNTSGQSVIIGAGASADFVPVTPGALTYNVVLGTQAYTNTTMAVVMGNTARAVDSQFAIAIGFQTTIDAGSSSAVAIGRAHVYANALSSISIGAGSAVGTGNDSAIVIGNAATNMGVNSAFAVTIGENATCLDNCDSTVVIGPNFSTVATGSAGTVALGFDIQVSNNATDSVVIGDTASASVMTSVVIGYAAVSRGGAVVIGSGLDPFIYPGAIPTQCLDGEGVVIGYQTQSLAVFANLTVNIGNHSIIYDGYQTTVIGPDNTVGSNIGEDAPPFSTIAGYGNTVVTPSTFSGCVCVGAGNNLTNVLEGSSIFGQSNVASQFWDSVVAGRANTLSPGFFNAVVGNDNTLTFGDYIVGMGEQLTVSADTSITLGFGATNTNNNTMVVGSDSHPIHTMLVNGNNLGTPVITLAVNDAPPADEQTGLTIAYNTGSGIVNRDVFISSSPPPGAIILYMVP